MRRNKKMRVKLIDRVNSDNPKENMRDKINTKFDDFDATVEIQNIEVVDGQVHAKIRFPNQRAGVTLTGDLREMVKEEFGADVVLGI